MYRVIYRGYNGGFEMTEEMSLEKAKEYKQKLTALHYPKVYIIQIID